MTRDAGAPVLAVAGLTIEVSTPQGWRTAVEDLSFVIRRGEVMGLVGESGSGKSLSMLAVLGLLPGAQARVAAGTVRLNGQDLRALPEETLRRLRGREVAMIFQDPMTALNPVIRVGRQIGEAIRIHFPRQSGRQVRDRVIALLDAVGVPNPERRYGAFPHEFSGGMRQRAMIAMAMANEPSLLIADEPTTALDVTIQAQVLDVLARARERTGAAMVLITHDLGLVAERADRLAVLYGGRLMEAGACRDVFADPRHPYTVGLMESLPRLDGDPGALKAIAGQPPSLAARPPGCVFEPRCDLGRGRSLCRAEQPPWREVAADRRAACHLAEEVRRPRLGHAPAQPGEPGRERAAAHPILRVEGVTRQFRVRRRTGWGSDPLRALDGVSLAVAPGETLGIVGESGCGKSTLGRAILGLQPPSAGAIYLDEHAISGLSARALRPHRPKMQVVFQDPYASLDPRMDVHDIVAEPMRINGSYDAARVAELLALVGLDPTAAGRRPAQFSGGQRQRIAIARALALDPKLIVLDEAVSALDVSIQAQIINVLRDLQRRRGLSYLFISHDLAVVRNISDRIAVMYLGRIVEIGSREAIFGNPAHPYTQALLAAVPGEDGEGRASRFRAAGELPDPLSPPSGCRYRTRCRMARDVCARDEPALADRLGDGRLSACHFAEEAKAAWSERGRPMGAELRADAHAS